MSNEEIIELSENETAKSYGSILSNEILGVEPFVVIAAGAVAAWLAQGAVNYLGGKAMASILGDPSLRDVKSWIRAAVEELKSFISEELHRQITQQYIDETTDNIDGMRRDLLDYDASKDAQILYQQFGSKMNTWISITTRLGLPVVLIYADSISLRTMVLAALIKDHHRKEFASRLRDTAEEGAAHIEACIKEHLQWLDDGISSVGQITIKHQKKFIPEYVGWFDYRGGRDGIGDNSRQVVEEKVSQMRSARVAAFEREKQLAIDSFHIPLRHAAEMWAQAAKRAAPHK